MADGSDSFRDALLKASQEKEARAGAHEAWDRGCPPDPEIDAMLRSFVAAVPASTAQSIFEQLPSFRLEEYRRGLFGRGSRPVLDGGKSSSRGWFVYAGRSVTTEPEQFSHGEVIGKVGLAVTVGGEPLIAVQCSSGFSRGGAILTTDEAVLASAVTSKVDNLLIRRGLMAPSEREVVLGPLTGPSVRSAIFRRLQLTQANMPGADYFTWDFGNGISAPQRVATADVTSAMPAWLAKNLAAAAIRLGASPSTQAGGG